jgi:hypothetical protein
MPAGDPQRTWFPEMLEILRARWHVDLPFAELIELRDELDTMLHRIRAERHIRPPVIRCPQCGHVGEAAEPDVSVRAMILSLRRFGMAPAEHVKMLEKRWATYRKQNGLDLYGKTSEPAVAGAPARSFKCGGVTSSANPRPGTFRNATSFRRARPPWRCQRQGHKGTL